jgi:hypothetical protein
LVAWIMGVTGKGCAVCKRGVKTVGRLRRFAFEIDVGTVLKGGEAFNFVDQIFEVLHDPGKVGKVGGFDQGQIDSVKDHLEPFEAILTVLYKTIGPYCMVCTKIFKAERLPDSS